MTNNVSVVNISLILACYFMRNQIFTWGYISNVSSSMWNRLSLSKVLCTHSTVCTVFWPKPSCFLYTCLALPWTADGPWGCNQCWQTPIATEDSFVFVRQFTPRSVVETTNCCFDCTHGVWRQTRRKAQKFNWWLGISGQKVGGETTDSLEMRRGEIISDKSFTLCTISLYDTSIGLIPKTTLKSLSVLV